MTDGDRERPIENYGKKEQKEWLDNILPEGGRERGRERGREGGGREGGRKVGREGGREGNYFLETRHKKYQYVSSIEATHGSLTV